MSAVVFKSCLLLPALALAGGLLSAPAALAHDHGDKCKHKTAAVHKTKVKAKAKPQAKKAKVTKVAAVHKSKPKAKPVKTSAKSCDCKTEVRYVTVVQPVIEREVTVYRAEPRPWRAPYVDEVAHTTYESEHTYSESYSETRSQTSRQRTDYLSVDTRPEHHSWTRWP